jgi:hypothetical protein
LQLAVEVIAGQQVGEELDGAHGALIDAPGSVGAD